MLPYYALVGIPALIALVNRIINIKFKKVSLKVLVISSFFLGMIVLLALRGMECGIDLPNYKTFFDFSHYRPFSFVRIKYGIEVGYHLVEYIVALCTQNFQILLAVVACVSVIPVWIMYAKESDMPYLTIVLFLTLVPFGMYFSGLRQVVAMAFVVPAYYCMKHKKLVWFLIVTFIAMLFHTSTIFIIVLYPLYHVRITKKWLYFTVPIMALIFIFNEYVFDTLFMLFGGKYVDRYAEMEGDGAAYLFMIMLVGLAVISFLITDDKQIDNDIIGLRNILLLAICVQFFAPVHPLAMRMNYYFLMFVPMLIPKVLRKSRPEVKQITTAISIVLTIFFTFWFFYDAHTDVDILEVFPYVPFWR